MDYIRAFNTVRSEYGEGVATLFTAMLAIHLSTPAKKIAKGELQPMIQAALWEHLGSPEYDLAAKCHAVWYEYETRLTLDGVGGCKAKALSSLVNAL